MKAKNQRLENGEIYRYDREKGFDLVDPLQFKYKGYTLRKLSELNEKRVDLINKIKRYQEKLKKHVEGETLFDMLDKLLEEKEKLIINRKDKHTLLRIEGGYAHEGLEGNYYTHNVELPEDLDKKTYYVKNGKLYKDNKREEELWISLM